MPRNWRWPQQLLVHRIHSSSAPADAAVRVCPLLLLLLLLLRQITEPYLQIYRGILPPLFGQLDFTPLFGFLILQVCL
jgi:hypothetical protein